MNNGNFNTFDEIEYKPLRSFNRLVFFTNLIKDKGVTPAKDYLELLSDTDRREMYLVKKLINAIGEKAVREEVTKNVVFTYDPSEDVEYGV